MATTWTIAVDWERNGNFTGTYDDITTRVSRANWFIGMHQPYDDLADDGMLNLVVDNVDRRFSPEYSGSPISTYLRPFRPVRIQSNDGTTTRTHYVGWIERIEPMVNAKGKRQARIVAAGPLLFLQAAETNMALQENQRTDQIVAALIKEVVIPPAIVGAFMVGVSHIGVDTFVVGETLYSTLDSGISVLKMAGDNWVQQGNAPDERETFDVYRAIQDVTAAERGRFLLDRSGKALFWNRHRLLQATSPAATFDDTMQDMEYVYSSPDELKNEIIAVGHPRSISATANEILWQLDNEIRIPGNSERKLQARYRDDSGNRIGGRTVSVADITFSEGTATITITPKANSAELVITNSSSQPAVLTACTLRGEKITDFGRMEATAKDELSIAYYGRRTLRLNLPAVDSLEDAQNIAQFELNRRKSPRGSVRQVQLVSHGVNPGGHQAQQLARTLGDKIRVGESQTDHEADYHIIGEAHRLSEGGTLFETTWYLEPVTAGFWTLGVTGQSEIGTKSVLAY